MHAHRALAAALACALAAGPPLPARPADGPAAPGRSGDAPVAALPAPRRPCAASERWALAVQGGAVARLADLSPAHRAQLAGPASQLVRRVLEGGMRGLAAGARALDAVEAAVVELEDSGLLNAGSGAIAGGAGVVEADAALMDGATRAAGAVAAVRGLRNPIRAARLVLERSPHVLLAGPGAESFALAHGAEPAPPGASRREPRALRGEREAARHVGAGAHRDRGEPGGGHVGAREPQRGTHLPGGTVGAVALDRCGHLAAATSTGGFAGKLAGRVGDSPVVGAGTFADDASVAVSASGHGESLLRHVVAHEIASLVRHRGLPLREAARRAVQELPAGSGGVVAVDAHGEAALEFNTEAMLRALATWRSDPEVRLER